MKVGVVVRNRAREVALVTDAVRNREEEFASRKRRYVLTMVARIVALIGACLLITVNAWLALGLVAFGMVAPWLAVLMANDGPPKNSRRMRRYTPPPAERTLEAGPRADRVIDATPPAADDSLD